MKILKTILTVAILSISCSKDNDEPQPETPKVATVYVGGNEFNANNKSVPTIWKDGITKPLPTSLGIDGKVLAIFIDGEVEYAVGFESLNNTKVNNRAVIWKNGIKTTLSQDTSVANAVYVSNGKAYVVGTVNNTATLWYDNRSQALNGNEATAVYVKNNDIFICVNISNGAALLFKNNGSLTQPSFSGTSLGTTVSNAYSISKQDNDTFIAGISIENGISNARLWKNLTSTQPFENETEMFSVFALGQNIYACGEKIINNTRRAILWKNNEPTVLSQSISSAQSVFATATNVYVAGSDGIDNLACIWKNGTIETLSTNKSSATSVFVTEK